MKKREILKKGLALVLAVSMIMGPMTGLNTVNAADSAGDSATTACSESEHVFDSDGFCECGATYMPAELKDGVYEIKNAGQLYWFAGLVNGDSAVCDYDAETNPDGVKQNTKANAVLKTSIIINSNLLYYIDESGVLEEGYDARPWIPISSYNGTFDGNGKAIYGIYCQSGETNQGLFAHTDNSGKIQNLEVRKSYIEGTDNIGGICARNNGTIEGCSFDGIVKGSGDVGGITGFMQRGEIKNCSNTGRIIGNMLYIGGICGYAYNSSASIVNCVNTGEVSGSNYVGGIAGVLNTSAAIKNCCNLGDITGDTCGAIAGKAGESTSLLNCYYVSDVAIAKKDSSVTTENVTQVTVNRMESGEIAWLLQDAQEADAQGKKPHVWGQILSGHMKEPSPRIGGMKVYASEDETPVYTNIYGTLSEGDNTVDVANDTYVWYGFTPTTSGVYKFSSTNSEGTLYGCTEFGSDTASTSIPAETEYILTEGIEYYFAVRSSEDTCALSIQKNGEYQTSVSEGDNSIKVQYGLSVWYEFIPDVTGTYVFSSNNSTGGFYIGESKESYTQYGIINSPSMELTAGTKYYLSLGDAIGNYNLNIQKLDTTLSVGNNPEVLAGAWYEFTPEKTGQYDFSSVAAAYSGIFVNTDKSTSGSNGIVNHPSYTLYANTKYYVKLDTTPKYYDLKIELKTELKEKLSLGDNTVLVDNANPIWHEFTPESSGVYTFTNKSGLGSIYVNTDKSNSGSASFSYKPYFELTKDVTYYVRMSYSNGAYDLNIAKINTTLSDGKNSIKVGNMQPIWYEFTPTTTGSYMFSSTDCSGGIFVNEDKSNSGHGGISYPAVYELTANHTYYVRLSHNVGDYEVKIEKINTNLTTGDNTFVVSSTDMLWYTFTPTATGVYIFSSKDVTGTLYVNTDKEADGSGSATEAVYKLTKDTTYYVGIYGNPGTYGLNITHLGTTLSVGNNTVKTGREEPIWYEFTPTTTGSYMFSSTDCSGGIYVNEDKSDSGSGGIAYSPVYELTANHTYYVRLSASVGDYAVKIEEIDTNLKTGDNTFIVSSADMLWYTFTPTATGVYIFSSKDATGTLYVNTDKGTGGSAPATEAVYKLTKDTTYYVGIYNNPGTYGLNITQLDTTLSVGNNTVKIETQPIWYKFTPTTTAIYKFSSTDAQGVLYVNQTEEENESLNITENPELLLNGGTTYYVKMSYYDGNYGLKIEKRIPVSLYAKLNGSSHSDGEAMNATEAGLKGAGTYSDGTQVTIEAPERTGYTFLGWYLVDGDKVEVSGNRIYTFTPEEALELWAIYGCNHDTYNTSTTKATLSNDGEIYSVCQECAYEKTEVIPMVSSITLDTTAYTYDGKVKTPSVEVKDRTGKELIKDTDYTVTYQAGRMNAGTYKVTVTLKGNYSGSKTLSFKINPKAVTPAVTLDKTSFAYDGKEKRPAVTVKLGSTVLVAENYAVTYSSGRKEIGTYKVTVTLKGNYSGTKTVSYTIVPGKVTGLKQWTSEYSTSRIKMSWTKVAGAEGYAMYRATEKDGTYKLVKTVTTTPCTNEGLKAGSKFYYKIRAYKTVDGKKVYGEYSDPKCMVTKPAAPAVTLTAGSKSAKITWTKSTSASGYEVYMSTKKDGTYTKIKTANASTLSYTKTGLKSGQKYYIKVKAYTTLYDGTKVYSGWSALKGVTPQ